MNDPRETDPLIRQLAGQQRRDLAKMLDDAELADRLRRAKRNEPCPCGSGLKFKHCCRRRVRR